MESIAAISTPPGSGGIAVIRLSGENALQIADKVWKGARLTEARSHTAHLGEIIDASGNTLDQAVATVFAQGKSFTGEATVEFSIHGSPWLQHEIIARLIEAGASAAAPGEFTRRAFMNGRIDLTQAEAIADLISSGSKAAHRIATLQMKGALSAKLEAIRNDMIKLASLLELELDFSEEDVEFADRVRLQNLCESSIQEISGLCATFRSGHALKEGVPTVIAGIPNAGKSTLLNYLTGDDKAIVSSLPGTTRDAIEDTAEIDGILYRFIDTAGLRDTSDEIERIGIAKARTHIQNARIILWLIDPTADLTPQNQIIRKTLPLVSGDARIIPILSKSDLICIDHDQLYSQFLSSENDNFRADTKREVAGQARKDMSCSGFDDASCAGMPEADRITSAREMILSESTDSRLAPPLAISVMTGEGIEEMKHKLKEIATEDITSNEEIILTNLRHYESLKHTVESLERVANGLHTGLSADFIAQDLREATHHLGAITGAITTDTLLHSIFSTFCIGK